MKEAWLVLPRPYEEDGEYEYDWEIRFDDPANGWQSFEKVLRIAYDVLEDSGQPEKR